LCVIESESGIHFIMVELEEFVAFGTMHAKNKTGVKLDVVLLLFVRRKNLN